MSKKTTTSFTWNISRFFMPMRENIWSTLHNIIYFCSQYSFQVLFIFFLRDVVNSFELWDKDLFYQVMKNYCLYFLWLYMFLLFVYSWWTSAYNRYRTSIESHYLEKFVRLDATSIEKTGTWKIISIISWGINTWSSLIDSLVIFMLSMLISLCITIYFLSDLNNYLVVLLVVLLIVWQVIGYIANKKVIGIRLKRIDLANEWSRSVVKIIMSKMEILQTGKIREETHKLHLNHEKQIYYNKKMALYLTPFFSIWNIIVMVLFVVSFYYFSVLYFNDEITLSSIAALSWAIMIMQKDFISSLDFVKNFWKNFAQVQNIWNFFDEAPIMKWYNSWKEFISKKWDISLQNTSFWYTENLAIIQNLSLELQWWKVTALVWPSGWGKSTLVKLIAWYIHTDRWEISIDWQNLSEVSLKSYYKNIGYLTQEPSVFDGTIRDNLWYALAEAVTDEALKNVLELAECQFVFDMEKWIDTEIGERWIRLSWGQKQRLAIAKIFLKNPKIILLDEPTSALDSISEKQISLAMQKLFENRTVIVIAHRLQTVKHADEIIYLSDWKIVERGNHEELVKQKWLYNQMLELQSWF